MFRETLMGLMGVVVCGLIWVNPCQAQPQLPPSREEMQVQKPTSPTTPMENRFASGLEEYIPGMTLKLKLKNPPTAPIVNGKLIWAEPGFFVLRAQPGVAPQKFAWDNIEEVIRVKNVRGTENGSNVKFATPLDRVTEERLLYPLEIQKVTINDGAYQYGVYFNTGLSTREEELLDKLQKAEKAMVEAQKMSDQVNDILRDSIALQKNKSEALSAYYQNNTFYALGFNNSDYVYNARPLYYVDRFNRPFFGNFGGFGYGPGFNGYGGGYGRGYNQVTQMTNPISGETKGASSEDVIQMAEFYKKKSNEMIQQARADLQEIRNYAMYTTDGRLVAMNTWDKK